MTYINNNINRKIKRIHLLKKEIILIEAYKGEYSNR